MLKTNVSKIKVRTKDLKSGVTVYVSHPVYGIEKMLILSKPYNFGQGFLGKPIPIVKCYHMIAGKYIKTTGYLNDMGICEGNTTNGRRTFFKLKHAVAYQESMMLCPKFLKDQEDHERRCADMYDEFY